MVLSKEEVQEELCKTDLREIYRRYCERTGLTEEECHMIKNYDETHTIEKAIQLRIDSLKEYQQIRQEKCKEIEINRLIDLLEHEELADKYLIKEYEQMERDINNTVDETVSSKPDTFDLCSQKERERICDY
ncbi:hypothetical protein [Enterococcus faecium]|uniref:hypothetical protein n=1 Tax=Enterococcus faecium TaxID=1352 RepID=UPI0019124DF0|nr:hypothetical protein [Enterococcus faecium]MBK5028740.1 hypothetical protein [Enterococcus faecium]MBK5039439.1 hypothetical protein [Enterococcus faecium]MBK5044282.1 hypothetical protein [Enterococcus faecium]MBK5069200.1 hypothetical protein [Enterococcus faecium]MBK5132664.1 hypothetical protein [Enterococcus faecium]